MKSTPARGVLFGDSARDALRARGGVLLGHSRIVLFNSVEFFAFFLVAGTAVVLLRRRVTARNIVLVIAGYFFYAQWDWRFLGLLVLTTLLDYAAGMLLDDGRALT